MCASWEVASSKSSFLVWHHRWLPPSYQRSSQQYGPLVLRLNEILHPPQSGDVVHELTTNPVLLPLDDPRVVLVAGHQVVENLLIANSVRWAQQRPCHVIQLINETDLAFIDDDRFEGQVAENLLIANSVRWSQQRPCHVIQLINETDLAFIDDDRFDGLSMPRCPRIRLAGGTGQEIGK